MSQLEIQADHGDIPRPYNILPVSARSSDELETRTATLVAYLKRNLSLNVADVAYTLQVERRAFGLRRFLVCADIADAIRALEPIDPKRVFTGNRPSRSGGVIFMFSGIGNHYINMGREVYRTESVYRRHVELCCEMLEPHLGIDLRPIIYPDLPDSSQSVEESAPAGAGLRIDLRKMLRGDHPSDGNSRALNQVTFTHPALFVVEYALSRMWMEWGVVPEAMIGYSLGEYVAACVSGVFSLEDALFLIAKRAEMIEELAGGAMLAVGLSERDARPWLGLGVSLASTNGGSVVLSGPTDAIDGLQDRLKGKAVCRRLQASHAFHSPMMKPISEPFSKLVRRVKLNAPRIPFVSNVTGEWITAGQATDPDYWAAHLCRPVRFGRGLQTLWRHRGRALLEVGPGQGLGAWAMQHPDWTKSGQGLVTASVRHSYDQQPDLQFLLNSLGKLWLSGIDVDWAAIHALGSRQRLPLPV